MDTIINIITEDTKNGSYNQMNKQYYSNIPNHNDHCVIAINQTPSILIPYPKNYYEIKNYDTLRNSPNLSSLKNE